MEFQAADQLGAGQEINFMMTAKKKISELFGCLTSDEAQSDDHAKLMGYIMGYLSMLTGHRSIVLINMSKDNVSKFETLNHGKQFQILVDEHKTSKTHGPAVLILNQEEFGWLEKLTNGMCCLPGQDSPYVFHTVQGNQIQKPVYSLQMAWTDSGMTGEINFTKIRSSVLTQAQKHLTEKQRRDVAKAMAHDPQTAERFYVALPDKKKSYQTRELRLKALGMAAEEEESQ